MKTKKGKSDKDPSGFNFVQMIEDKKRMLEKAEGRRKLVRNHQSERTGE